MIDNETKTLIERNRRMIALWGEIAEDGPEGNEPLGEVIRTLEKTTDSLERATTAAAPLTVPVAWREAVQEFVDRVERGEVRSKRTYGKFKELLSDAPALVGDSRDTLNERLLKALRTAEETLEAYADPTGYNDNYGEQVPADAEVHQGLAAAQALVEVRAALAAKEQQS
ncbi:hypothetical protein GOB57_21225 [Sinorhizobium meliloti]|nr:hypothetical protein [Sinorhizobium meliloti]